MTCPSKIYPSFPVPSRLKGMETLFLIRTQTLGSYLVFPCTFPFEGNGNRHQIIKSVKLNRTFPVPSRLKGIETILVISVHQGRLDLTFPVPSRLKGMET